MEKTTNMIRCPRCRRMFNDIDEEKLKATVRKHALKKHNVEVDEFKIKKITKLNK